MLRFLCDEPGTGSRVTRREWLRIGGLASLAALTASRGARATEQATARHLPGFGRARSVIVVFTGGGVSQLDSWDPKPDAPAEVRGEFRAIRTATPGTLLCEHLPRLAALSNRYALIRSMAHDDFDHGSACYLALTGQFHPRRSSNPPPTVNDFPTLGAVLRRVRPSERFPYTAVHLNGPVLTPREAGPGQFGGFLGRAHEPLVLGDVTDPQRDTARPGAAARPARGTARPAARAARSDRCPDRGVEPASRAAWSAARRCSGRWSSSRRRAIARSSIWSASRRASAQRYGSHRSGQACLLARRLVEAGVPWVTVMWNHMIRGQDMTPTPEDEYGWDTHNDIFPTLRDHLLPRLDHTLSALLDDLHERGLLEQTLVVCMGEFGRAPRVAPEASFAGAVAGRKHWASVYSVLAAGAGVPRRRGGRRLGPPGRLPAHGAVLAVRPRRDDVRRARHRSDRRVPRPRRAALPHQRGPTDSGAVSGLTGS